MSGDLACLVLLADGRRTKKSGRFYDLCIHKKQLRVIMLIAELVVNNVLLLHHAFAHLPLLLCHANMYWYCSIVSHRISLRGSKPCVEYGAPNVVSLKAVPPVLCLVSNTPYSHPQRQRQRIAYTNKHLCKLFALQ